MHTAETTPSRVTSNATQEWTGRRAAILAVTASVGSKTTQSVGKSHGPTLVFLIYHIRGRSQLSTFSQ